VKCGFCGIKETADKATGDIFDKASFPFVAHIVPSFVNKAIKRSEIVGGFGRNAYFVSTQGILSNKKLTRRYNMDFTSRQNSFFSSDFPPLDFPQSQN